VRVEQVELELLLAQLEELPLLQLIVQQLVVLQELHLLAVVQSVVLGRVEI
tara:strand:+ start:140 stop:292 length:153 start_codon:yes stop_codon:yes gene_type:complete